MTALFKTMFAFHEFIFSKFWSMMPKETLIPKSMHYRLGVKAEVLGVCHIKEGF